MNPLILAIAIIAIPVVALTVLRINAAIVFLSLCLGEVLVMFVSKDATSTVGILNSTGHADLGMVSFGLLVVPAILTAFCMIGTIKGKLTQVLNVLPAIAVGVLTLLLAKPLFSGAMQSGIESTVIWEQVQGLQTIVVSASALISLFFLWIQRPKSKSKEEGKKHK
jgi:hypothetical protein